MSNDWNIEGTENGSIEVKVNGESIGTVPPTSTLREVVREYANQRGLRTFSVYLDGQRVDQSPASQAGTLAGRHTLEIVAKDVRGN